MAVTREGELCLTSCHFSDRDSEVSVLSFKCLILNELISIFVINIPFIHSVYAVNRMNGLHRMYAEWFTYLNRMYIGCAIYIGCTIYIECVMYIGCMVYIGCTIYVGCTIYIGCAIFVGCVTYIDV